MSREAIDLTRLEQVRTLFKAVDDKDWPTMVDYYNPRAVYHRPGYDPFIGITKILDYYKNLRLLGSGNHTIEGIISQGSQVAYWGEFLGYSRSGEPVDVQFMDRCLLDAGKILYRTTYFFTPHV